MVDVGEKAESRRIACAEGSIFMLAATFEAIRAGTSKKGDVLGIARLAAIQATKRTSELIPLCHPIALTHVVVDFDSDPEHCKITCRVTTETVGRTGVEMEALTGVSIALLTIYDMCKAMDRGMHIEGTHLLEKDGGKSGHWLAERAPPSF